MSEGQLRTEIAVLRAATLEYLAREDAWRHEADAHAGAAGEKLARRVIFARAQLRSILAGAPVDVQRIEPEARFEHLRRFPLTIHLGTDIVNTVTLVAVDATALDALEAALDCCIESNRTGGAVR